MIQSALIRKLSAYANLTESDKAALQDLIVRIREIKADEDIVREGESPNDCHVVIEGLLCRYKLLPEGRRQIVAFALPGDFCDLPGMLLGRVDQSVATLARSKVAIIPARKMAELAAGNPRIAKALWCDTAVEGSIANEWQANLGRRSSYQRVAHLICEVGTRLFLVGNSPDRQRFIWPATQTEIGDALGLSTVHVNRVVQLLRLQGHISKKSSTFEISDWNAFRKVADFNPSYLYTSGPFPWTY